jgi:hypothetical protein
MDGHGNRILSLVYRCSSIQVGELILTGVEMSAFDFGDHMRGRLEGAPIMLGTNVLERAKWSFDIPAGRWTVEPN